MKPSVAIELLDVTKRFFPNTASEVTALDQISLEIYSGEWLYVLGGNGCGKSTLLRMISGQWYPSSGRVVLQDNGRSSIFFVEAGSQFDLIPSMTVYENLMLVSSDERRMPSLRSYHSTGHKRRFIETLQRFGLGIEHRLSDQVIGLSGGQQQAVVAAKVLLSSAKILLLDEFTSALDKKTAPVILRILREHCRANGITVVAVTHDYYWIEEMADRVVLMETGQIVDILRRASSEDTSIDWSRQQGHVKETIIQNFSADFVMERLYGKKKC
jgi:putative ABC transport system ATP-binding protein